MKEESSFLTGVLTARRSRADRGGGLRGVHRLGEDVSGGLSAADHMGVDAKRYCGVGVAQASGGDVNGDAREQQGRGVQMSKVM
jgi:hypothetical protein